MERQRTARAVDTYVAPSTERLDQINQQTRQVDGALRQWGINAQKDKQREEQAVNKRVAARRNLDRNSVASVGNIALKAGSHDKYTNATREEVEALDEFKAWKKQIEAMRDPEDKAQFLQQYKLKVDELMAGHGEKQEFNRDVDAYTKSIAMIQKDDPEGLLPFVNSFKDVLGEDAAYDAAAGMAMSAGNLDAIEKLLSDNELPSDVRIKLTNAKAQAEKAAKAKKSERYYQLNYTIQNGSHVEKMQAMRELAKNHSEEMSDKERATYDQRYKAIWSEYQVLQEAQSMVGQMSAEQIAVEFDLKPSQVAKMENEVYQRLKSEGNSVGVAALSKYGPSKALIADGQAALNDTIHQNSDELDPKWTANMEHLIRLENVNPQTLKEIYGNRYAEWQLLRTSYQNSPQAGVKLYQEFSKAKARGPVAAPYNWKLREKNVIDALAADENERGFIRMELAPLFEMGKVMDMSEDQLETMGEQWINNIRGQNGSLHTKALEDKFSSAIATKKYDHTPGEMIEESQKLIAKKMQDMYPNVDEFRFEPVPGNPEWFIAKDVSGKQSFMRGSLVHVNEFVDIYQSNFKPIKEQVIDGLGKSDRFDIPSLWDELVSP